VEFDVGHAVHTLVLGVGSDVVEIPREVLSDDGGIRSAKAKAWVADARSEGKIPLKSREYGLVKLGVESIMANRNARRLLEKPGDREVSMFGTDWRTGLRTRGRADVITEDGEIGDVKTTIKGLDDRALQALVEDRCYDMQGEMYRTLFELCKGHTAEPVTLIVVEKNPPYDCRPVVLDDEWIEGGWAKLRLALDRYRDCVEAGVWPGVDGGGEGTGKLPAPGWYTARWAPVE
jgi:hypothetical protein